MTDLTPIECEARLMGLSKTRRKDGDWFEAKFHIHPDDMTRLSGLFLLPLGTACNLAISGTDETTTEDAAEPVQAETAPETVEDVPERPTGTEGWSQAKRAMVQRSGIVRREESFQRFLESNWPGEWAVHVTYTNHPSEAAAEFMHQYCCVESCRDLDPNDESGRAFLSLMGLYEAAEHGQTDENLREQAR